MNRLTQFLKRLAADNVKVESVKIPAMSIHFFDDGTTRIDGRVGYMLTHSQQVALREMECEQLYLALQEFERLRGREKVVAFPMSREIN